MPDLLVHGVEDVARGAEAQTLGAATLRQNQCVDPDDPAAQIDQRSAAIARVDRRVGLHVNHRRLAIELPRDRAHDAERHRVVESERAAKLQDELTSAQIVGIAERHVGEIPLVDLDDREVRFEIDAGNRRLYGAASRPENRIAGYRQRDIDLQPLRTGDFVTM